MMECGSKVAVTASRPIRLNAFSVRRWHTPTYAWNAGLVLGLGGGSRNEMGMTKT